MRFPINHKFAKQSGVSLVEMLVAVGIIGLLAALLLPSINKISEKGRAVKCMNNLKQISVAMNAYAADHDARLPAAASNSASGGSDNELGNWYGELSPYYQFSGIVLSQWLKKAYDKINCPTFITKYQNKPDFSSGWVGFGMNNYLNLRANDTESTAKIRMRVHSIPDPSHTILVGEGTGLNLDIRPWGYHFKQNASELEGWQKGGTPNRHGICSHYLFVDGHIEALTPQNAEEFLKPYTGS